MKPILLGAILFVAGAAAGVGGAYFYSTNVQPTPPITGGAGTGGGTTASDDAVVAQGKLLPAHGLISVGGTPGDQVLELYVKAGDPVKPGDKLAKLLSYNLYEIEVKALEHQRDDALKKLEIEQKTAAFQLQKADLGVEFALNQQKLLGGAKEQIGLLEKQHQLEVQKLEKIRQLREESPRLVTEAEVEAQQLLTEKLAIDIDSANLELENKTIAAEGAVKSARQDQTAAKEKVEMVKSSDLIGALEQQILAAEMKRDQSILKSPIDGVVMKIFVQKGDSIARTPVLQVANLNKVHCIVDVYESQRKRVNVGDTVEMTSNALPDGAVLTGEVVSIDQSVGEPGMASAGPFAPADTRTVEVAVELKQEWNEIVAQYINLQVEARIDVQ